MISLILFASFILDGVVCFILSMFACWFSVETYVNTQPSLLNTVTGAIACTTPLSFFTLYLLTTLLSWFVLEWLWCKILKIY